MVKGFYDIICEWKSEAQIDTAIMVSRYPENSEVLKIMTTRPCSHDRVQR